MDEYNLKILELFREETTLNIGIRVRGPYDPMVHNPKITVVFDNGVENRRIPVVVQGYFPDESLKTCTIFAKYDYFMQYLFYNSPENEYMDMWFEFTYGEKRIEKIPFTISGDVKFDEDELYDITVSNESNQLHFHFLADLVEEKELNPIARVFQMIGGWIWDLVMKIVLIPLIPVFIIESFLAWIGVASTAPKNRMEGGLFIVNHFRWRVNWLLRKNYGKYDMRMRLVTAVFNICRLFKIKDNRIVFISNRRNDMTGNFEYVYNILKENKNLDIRFILDDRVFRDASYRTFFRYGRYLATSRVILVDDFIALLFKIPRREGTHMMQLWHACGAFKTFGYSRIGKPGGQKQSNIAHRIYDGAIVSSKEIAKYYAEGFGISETKVVATGIPRTDIFFSTQYKEKVEQAFYGMYPKLKDKKIILFAPTFRGNGKRTGFYPVERFDAVKLYEEMKGEYAILIKHHPFVPDRSEIPEEYADYIIDMSENSELNDLLFVTDLLISDYSSVIFEAALLDIPMLFFAFDLQRYISTRGFYYEYEEFVPGKIVTSFGQLMKAVEDKDFEEEKIHKFKTRFFDDLDGKSSERVVNWIYGRMEKEGGTEQ